MNDMNRDNQSVADHLRKTAEVRQALTDVALQLEELGYDQALIQGVMVGQGVFLAQLSCGPKGAVAWLRSIADQLEKVEADDDTLNVQISPTHSDVGSA